MSHQSDCERAIVRYYSGTTQDKGTLRSAYSDAAHLCDAIAKDIVENSRKGHRKPRKEILELAAQITKVGNEIFELRDKVTQIEGEKP